MHHSFNLFQAIKVISKHRAKALVTAGLICASASVGAAQYEYTATHRSTVLSSDGLNLAITEAGKPGAPSILFIHGFSQSAAAWQGQFSSALASRYHLLAVELRGHGYSSKPASPSRYDNSKVWADDIASVIAAKRLDNVVLVAWSYGGLPVLDYLKQHGQSKLAGLVFVATGFTLDLRPPQAGGLPAMLGAGVIENTATMAGIPAGPPGSDLDSCAAENSCASYQRQFEGTKRFLKMVPAKPLPDDIFDQALAYNLQTPPYVRRAMIIDRFFNSGPLDHSETLKGVRLPSLLIHGEKDRHVLPVATQLMHALLSSGGANSERLLYKNTGHAPFQENSQRFNTDILSFMQQLVNQ